MAAEMQEKAFLLGLHKKGAPRSQVRESMAELARLADTAGVQVVEIIIQTLPAMVPATYIGKGKLAQLKEQAEDAGVNTLIFDDELSPGQARNISDFTSCNVVDRTELILDIFSRHARTKQSRMQVELAQLEYSYSRLKNMWKHLSRIKGGIGFRGPGETQIEVDRREINKRITILKKRLDDFEATAQNKRKGRDNYTSISLVGYTNAGKSTLFNRLVKEERYVADQLFATLDSLTRSLHNQADKKVVITDTIGFIKKLPHGLVSSFHTTLLEVTEADLLLHVVDVSNPQVYKYIESVESVLKEIGADKVDTLMVFNKLDQVNNLRHRFLIRSLKDKYPHAVYVSAKTGENLDTLREKIDYFLTRKHTLYELHIPVAMQSLVSFLHSHGEVLHTDYNENEILLKVRLTDDTYKSAVKQIEEYKLLQYINKQ